MHGDSGDNWFGNATATFGDRLAAAREAGGMGQEDVARCLGVRAKTVGQWENDASEPRANRMQMLAGMLGVSLSWLMTGTGAGLAAPDAERQPPPLAGLLVELQHLRRDMESVSARMATVEARLRATIRAADPIEADNGSSAAARPAVAI